MFIKNTYGEFINVHNVIAVEVAENVEGMFLCLYTEKSKMVLIPEDGDLRGTLDRILHHLRGNGAHIIHLGSYYLVIEAIDSILLEAYGMRVYTNNQNFAIVMSSQDSPAITETLAKHLPSLDV